MCLTVSLQLADTDSCIVSVDVSQKITENIYRPLYQLIQPLITDDFDINMIDLQKVFQDKTITSPDSVYIVVTILRDTKHLDVAYNWKAQTTQTIAIPLTKLMEAWSTYQLTTYELHLD